MSTIISWADTLAEYEGECLGVVVLDREFRIQAISDTVLQRGGYTEEQILGMSALDVVHPDDLARAAEVIAEVVMIDGDRAPGMYRLMFANDGWATFELQAINLGDRHDGALVMRFDEVSAEVRIRAFAEDVIEITQLLVETRSTAESIGRIIDFAERHVDGISVAVTTFAPDGSASTVSRRDLPIDMLECSRASHPLSLPTHVGEAFDLRRSGPWRANNRAGVLSQGGRYVVIALVDDEGKMLGFVQVLRSTTDEPEEPEWLVYASLSQILRAVLVRQGLDNMLRFAADHDSLTGLLNRRRLLELMGEKTELGGSGLLMIDLDKFSWINNTLGHAAGDTALISVGQCMLGASPDDAVVARLGGDEFVIWIPRIDALDDMNRLAELVRSRLVVPVDIGDRRRLVRCSIGAVAIRAGETAEQAINRADKIMYEAKRSGGDRVMSA